MSVFDFSFVWWIADDLAGESENFGAVVAGSAIGGTALQLCGYFPGKSDGRSGCAAHMGGEQGGKGGDR